LNDTIDLINKAKEFLRKEKFKEGIEILENLFNNNSNSDEIRDLLIKSLFTYGNYLNDDYISDYKKALLIFSKIIEINPRNYRALYNLGISYYNLGENQKALDNYSKALSIKPDYKYCHYNIGLIYEDMDKLNKALESYEKALKIDNNFSYALHARNFIIKKLDRIKSLNLGK